MLYNIDINTSTSNISAKGKILALQYIRRRRPQGLIINVGIENVGSAGQAGFTYQAIV